MDNRQLDNGQLGNDLTFMDKDISCDTFLADNKPIVTLIPSKLKAPPKLLRVAAYARVSCGKDAMLHSLSAQVSYYSELIQRNPTWSYVGVYADEDCTDTNEDRPEFQRLLADCRAGKIDMVITKSVSRFARNTLITLQTVRELKALDIDCYFEEEHTHSTSGDGELLLTLLASYAQEESLSVSENCKWKIRHGFKDGKPTYVSPFGYKMVKGKLIVIPEEAEIVKMIFALFLSGLGRNAIMKELKRAGVVTRSGIRFGESVIGEMLRNEKYAGDLCLQKTFTRDHISKKTLRNKGELPMPYVYNAHEAIIDRETFERVQAELDRRADFYKPKQVQANDIIASQQTGLLPSQHGQPYPFTGKIVCGNCGHNYRRKITNGKVAWNCITYLREGKEVCHAKQIPEETLYRLATEALGLNSFDETVFNTVFKNTIKEIRVPAFNHVVFVFHDGHKVERVWQDRSRSESWTSEMRERAKADAKMRRQGQD